MALLQNVHLFSHLHVTNSNIVLSQQNQSRNTLSTQYEAQDPPLFAFQVAA